MPIIFTPLSNFVICVDCLIVVGWLAVRWHRYPSAFNPFWWLWGFLSSLVAICGIGYGLSGMAELLPGSGMYWLLHVWDFATMILTTIAVTVTVVIRRKWVIKFWQDVESSKLARAQLETAHTELQQAHQEISDRLREAHIANESLSEIALAVSHDLKTPLTSIMLYLSRVLGQDSLDASEGRTHLEMALQNCRRLSRLVDGVLAVSRAGATAQGEAINVAAIIDSCAVAVVDLLGQGQIRNNVPKSVTIQATESALTQLFGNLISNAIKYRHQKRPLLLTVDCRQTQAGFEIIVSDNGMGMTDSFQHNAFKLFKQENPKSDGVGVGLPLCQRVMHSLGGDITFTSFLGKGTAFHLTFPQRLLTQ